MIAGGASSFTALLDACTLHPAPIRDVLMELAALRVVYRPKWSAQIHEEWIRSVIERDPARAGYVNESRAIMDRLFPDALVTGHDVLIPAITGLPDPGDRHVVAAAIQGRADVIVTFNLKDFPSAVLAPHNTEAQHPDVFLEYIFGAFPVEFCTSVCKIRARLTRPRISALEYASFFTKMDMPKTADFLIQHQRLL